MILKTIFLFLALGFSLTASSQKDTLGLKFIKNEFYKDSSGNIYFKNKIPNDGPHPPFYIKFVTTMPLTDWEKWDTLKNVIDLDSYTNIKDVYAKDKNHVYYFIYNSDGSTLRILKDADPQTFRHIKSDLGGDKNYIYKDGCKVEGADPNGKIKIYPAEYSNSPYFTDGKKVFHNCAEIKDADVATFKTIRFEASYDAEDKNHKYLSGKPLEK